MVGVLLATVAMADVTEESSWREYRDPLGVISIRLPVDWLPTPDRKQTAGGELQALEMGFAPPDAPLDLDNMQHGCRVMLQRLAKPLAIVDAEHFVRQTALRDGEMTLGAAARRKAGETPVRVMPFSTRGPTRRDGQMLVATSGPFLCAVAVFAPEGRFEPARALAERILATVRLTGNPTRPAHQFVVTANHRLSFRCPADWRVTHRPGPAPPVSIAEVTSPDGELRASLSAGPTGLVRFPPAGVVAAELRKEFTRTKEHRVRISGQDTVLLRGYSAERGRSVLGLSVGTWQMQIVCDGRLPLPDAVRRQWDELVATVYLGYSPRPEEVALPAADRGPIAYVRYSEFLASLATESPWLLRPEEVARLVARWRADDSGRLPADRGFFAGIEAKWLELQDAWQRKGPEDKAAFASICRRQYGWLTARQPPSSSPTANRFEHLLRTVWTWRHSTPTSRPAPESAEPTARQP